MLLLKKLIKKSIGVEYLNRRIDEVVVNKATNFKVQQIERDLHILRDAVSMLSEMKDDALSKRVEEVLAGISVINTSRENSFEDKKFIFVCGLHRSGTSLFTKILQEHPDISGFENTGVIEDEGQFLQTLYKPDRDLGWPGSFGFSKEAHLTEESNLISEKNRNKIFQQWSNYWDMNKTCLIEKSPPDLLKTRFLQALFPNSFFIIIRRHPVATCMATRKWSNSSMYSLIKHWVKCYDIWDEDKQYINNFIEIKYEDFILEPNKLLESVSELCELGKSDAIHDAVGRYNLSCAVNEKYFKEWDTMKWQKLLTNMVCKRNFERHGYEL